MAINFPSSPSLNQTFTVGNTTYVWNGSFWGSQTATSKDGAMAFIGEATVTDSATNTLTLSGLNLDVDGRYDIEIKVHNALTSEPQLLLTYNSDTTATNYWRQARGSDGSSTYAGRSNSAALIDLVNSSVCFGTFVLVKDYDGKARVRGEVSQADGSAIRLFEVTHMWNVAGNVTSLTISTTTNNLDVGTSVRVWKRTESAGGPSGGGGASVLYEGTPVDGTYTPDCSNGNIHKLVLTSATNIAAPINPTVDELQFLVQQNGTGGWPLTWDSTYRTQAGIAPTQSTSPNVYDIYRAQYDTSVPAWLLYQTATNIRARIPPVLLLHFDGTNASTTFTDEAGKIATVSGNAQLTTTSPKFGTACGVFDGDGDYITFPSSADFQFGTGDFSVEMFINATSWIGYTRVIALGAYLASGNFQIEFPNNTAITVHIGGSLQNYNCSALSTGVWHHLAVTRQSGDVRVYANGTQCGATTSQPGNVNSTSSLAIGGNPGNSNWWHGKIDELRIYKGLAIYTSSTIAVPVGPFSYP